MSCLPVLDDAELAQYSDAVNLQAVEAPLIIHAASFEAGAASITLSLAAIRNARILDERKFAFTVQFAIDSSEHWWSDDGGALKAAVTFDKNTRRMDLRLAFEPAGKGAIAAAADAVFLRAVDAATSLALRMPNGELAPERIPIPGQFVVDDGLLSFLLLLSDVSQLAGADITVPQEMDRKFANDLLVARGLLRGEEVRGKWHGGELKLESAALSAIKEAQEKSERHQFMIIGPLWLEIGPSQIYLGEIAQHISNVAIDSVRVDDKTRKVIISLCRRPGYADRTAGGPAWRAGYRSLIGITRRVLTVARGCRGTRAGCLGPGSGRGWCRVAGRGRGPVP
jgi:hypothetical protein